MPNTENLTCCHRCNESVEETLTVGNNEYCETCEAKLPDCEGCGETIEDGYLCEHCEENTSVCCHCETRVPTDEMFETYRREIICSSCAEDGTIPEDSSSWYPYDELTEVDGDWFLEPQETHGINSYHGTTKTKIPGSGRNCLGFELEVEPQEDESSEEIASDLYDRVKNIHCESDGSLSDQGFEIITDYGDLNQILKIAEKLSNELSGKVYSHDAKNCGLHVHLSKNNCSHFDIAKLVVFFNDFDNWGFINTFSRRSCDDYAKLHHQFNKQSLKTNESICNDREELNSKYNIVNIKPFHTVEIRIFRGTTNKDTLCACIEFAYYAWEYCKQTNDIDKLNWRDFVKYVPKTAAYFHNYLERKCICA